MTLLHLIVLIIVGTVCGLIASAWFTARCRSVGSAPPWLALWAPG